MDFGLVMNFAPDQSRHRLIADSNAKGPFSPCGGR